MSILYMNTKRLNTMAITTGDARARILLMDAVKPKTFADSFEEQLEISERLYGSQVTFCYSEKELDRILTGAEAYNNQEKERIKDVVLQMKRKYQYMFR